MGISQAAQVSSEPQFRLFYLSNVRLKMFEGVELEAFLHVTANCDIYVVPSMVARSHSPNWPVSSSQEPTYKQSSHEIPRSFPLNKSAESAAKMQRIM
jgi:hypothetical protein